MKIELIVEIDTDDIRKDVEPALITEMIKDRFVRCEDCSKNGVALLCPMKEEVKPMLTDIDYCSFGKHK